MRLHCAGAVRRGVQPQPEACRSRRAVRYQLRFGLCPALQHRCRATAFARRQGPVCAVGHPRPLLPGNARCQRFADCDGHCLLRPPRSAAGGAGGHYDSAGFYLGSIRDVGAMAPDYHKLWMKVHRHRGNYPAAVASIEKAMAATDSLYCLRLDESFAGLEKKFNYQQLQLKNQELEINHFRTKLLVLICFIGIAALVILFYIYRNKAKMKQLEMDKELLEQRNLRIEKEMENTKLHEKQLELQKIVLINLEQYRKNAIKKPELIKDGFNPINNDHFFTVLTTAIDLEYPSLSQRLLQAYAQLNDTDISICCLLLAGFDTGMIASILDMKNDSMHTRRSRLRKKLNIDNSENLLDFLRQF
jgi:hypothetical protein